MYSNVHRLGFPQTPELEWRCGVGISFTTKTWGGPKAGGGQYLLRDEGGVMNYGDGYLSERL